MLKKLGIGNEAAADREAATAAAVANAAVMEARRREREAIEADKRTRDAETKKRGEEAQEAEKMAKTTSLRVGKYTVPDNSGEETTKGRAPRPFVYVPKDFDLTAPGAIGRILKAAGVQNALRTAVPSMVLRVATLDKRDDNPTARAVQGGPRLTNGDPTYLRDCFNHPAGRQIR